ncbi:MAG: ComEC/Rec2 family competence protein [Oscillospiraceae bacterium]|nr:ComEC/Rec2 family competence protein [Oscillospiraceae bacterium]
MRRLFALIGFTYLLTLAAAVSFGGTVSLILCNVCLLSFGALLFFRHKLDIRVFSLVLLTAAMALGSFSAYEKSHVAPMDALDGQTVVLTGRLCDLPYTQYGNYYYVLEVSELKLAEEGAPPIAVKPQKIRLTTQNPLELDLGEELGGKAHLFLPSGGDGFSSRSYYASKGILMMGFLYEYEGYTITPCSSISLYDYALRLRQTMTNAISSLLPEEEAGLLSAAVFGDRRSLSNDVRNDFVDSGIYHVLVVSGLHMSLISMLLLRLLRWFRVPRRLSIGLTAAVVLCFMAVTGFSPSVLRSGIMILIMLGGLLLHRKTDAINSLGIAVFLICFWNPYGAADLGLLLSFASTLGILVLTPRLQGLFREKCRWYTKERLGFCYRPISYMVNTLAVTIGVTVFTLPIFIVSGRSISLVAPLSNLLFLLPATGMIQTGFLAAIFSLLPVTTFLAEPLGLVAGLLGKFLLWGTHLLAGLPFATVSPSQDFVVLWLMGSLLILAFLLLFCRRRWMYSFGALLSCVLLMTGVFSNQILRADWVRVGVLDVGTGISVVLSKNHQAAVLGCGGKRTDVLEEYLQQEGVREITYLQLTSGDQREKKNALILLESYPVQNILLEQGQSTSTLDRGLAKAEKVSYYQNSADVRMLEDVTLHLDGSYSTHGIYGTIKELSFLMMGQSYVPGGKNVEKGAVDFLIADALPENSTGSVAVTTILSRESDELEILPGKGYLEQETVNLYTTGGKGNLILDIGPEKSVKIRRGS